MFKRQLLIGVSAFSIAAFGLSSMTYAHEGQPSNSQGHHEVQVNDDGGNDRLVELQLGDDRGVDGAAQPQRVDDNGVDAQPHT